VKTIRYEKMRNHKGCAACKKKVRDEKMEKPCGMFCLSETAVYVLSSLPRIQMALSVTIYVLLCSQLTPL